jgi:hypothetical protein
MGGTQIGSADPAQGLYLYLGVDIPEHARVAAVDSEDRDFADAFERVSQVAFEAWDRGSFMPRLVDSSNRIEPRMCQSCSVKEACLRGDSGSRYRLQKWVASERSEDAEASTEVERVALQLWDLGVGEA